MQVYLHMGTTLSKVWPTVHAERAQLVDDLSRVPDAAWSTPSLCPGWSVHDVLAHLIDAATTTRLGFVRRLIVARFDFDRDNETGIAMKKCASPSDTLDLLRRSIDATSTPPANPATRLVEAFVHGEDIRRPLQISATYPIGPVVEALTYQCRTTVNFGGGRERIDGLRLNTIDAEFEHGPDDGQQVSGTAIDLLLAVSGRPVPAGALSGPGAKTLVAD